MAIALYRKYRSRTLDEVVGQTHVTGILARSLAQGRIAHAYLLTGPKGVGKTSIARILAHAINQLPYSEESSHLDIIEIDAASNNGVEDVRDLREKVQLAPVSAAKKVYIIDEVHMLSKAAFNALLKTLEEPPEHIVFILATTDADKLPDTIISRTQRFTFRTVAPDAVAAHLKTIAEKEEINIDDDALAIIAARGEGSFRDSISLLDQLRSLADEKQGITRELVEQSLGLAPAKHVEKLLAAYEAKDLSKIVALLDESTSGYVQPEVLAQQLTHAIRQQIAKKPQLIELLDHLLDVPKSSNPGLKLLTVLAGGIKTPPKSVALVAPLPEVKASVEALSHPQPKAATEQPASVPSTTKIAAKPGPIAVSSPVPQNPHLSSFDWQDVVKHARDQSVALASVLAKCGHETKDDTLIIYTGNPFYKKKLDTPQHRTNLIQALSQAGAGEPLIETIPTPIPPKDSQAAAVAAIMGGGEEVTVDAS